MKIIFLNIILYKDYQDKKCQKNLKIKRGIFKKIQNKYKAQEQLALYTKDLRKRLFQRIQQQQWFDKKQTIITKKLKKILKKLLYIFNMVDIM